MIGEGGRKVLNERGKKSKIGEGKKSNETRDKKEEGLSNNTGDYLYIF